MLKLKSQNSINKSEVVTNVKVKNSCEKVSKSFAFNVGY